MVRTFPIAHYENLDQCRKMLPHAHAVLRSNVAGNGQVVLLRSILYENMARFYINVNHSGVVPQLLHQALTRATDELEEHDPLVLQMIRILAVALCDLGRSKESKPWLSRLMALEKKHHGKSHPQMLRAMSALAVYFQIEGKHRQAESILTEAVDNIDREQLNHLVGAMRVDITLQLVGVLIASRRHQEALARSIEALAVLEKKRCYPLDHPVALKIFAVQAIILRIQGQFEKAESICRRALKGRDIFFDPAQPYLLSLMEELEKALIGMHRFDEAEQVRAKILHVRAQTCQSGRRATSHSPEPLGSVVEEGTHETGSEELPIYTLDASVRLFDSCLLQKLEDHASDTSHKAHIKREALRTVYYPAPKNLRRRMS
ncbi:kinesin light chain [Colletotrichum musicola]|uniref:Kinesin light chain n=1 Tax=Colletotrichum musicola TaxID=2175873 RepID=A0A8H6JJS8_9PEZI|nr:kinesin light chain [Colletotrichum musicola]